MRGEEKNCGRSRRPRRSVLQVKVRRGMETSKKGNTRKKSAEGKRDSVLSTPKEKRGLGGRSL